MKHPLARLWRLGMITLLLGLAADFAHAQPAASLTVTAQDPSGAVVAGATVRINRQNEDPRTALTDPTGVVRIAPLTPGRYHIRVEADGLAPAELRNVNVRAGANNVPVRLALRRIETQVDAEEDRLYSGAALNSILTQDQIDALPDDPDEFERIIQEMAGPGGSIRVNGFRGGRLPPKSQIREIRIRMNPYSAENHEAGFIGVDIFTKPGLPDWHGTLNVGLRDEALGARNAFAPERGFDQRRRFGVSMDGPLWKGRTTLFLNAEGHLTYDSRTIVAALPDGLFRGLHLRPARQLDLSTRVEHALTESHSLRAEYQRNGNAQRGLGVGDFDLPERAFSSDTREHLIRLSDSGLLTSKVVNEFRLQARWQTSEIRPSVASTSPAITVLSAFNSGSAQIERRRRARDLEVTDVVDFVLGKHGMKAGVLVERGWFRSFERQNPSGLFVFSGLDAYRAGRPTTFSRRSGEPEVSFNQLQVGVFFQDEWRVRRNLSMSAGVRYEAQTRIADADRFAPRFGLAWVPRRNGKTTVRLGAGVFDDWVSSMTIEQTLRVNGRQQSDLFVLNPGFPDPLSSGLVRSLAPSRLQLDPSLSLPRIVQYSAGLERPLGERHQIRADLIRQRGRHLLRSRDVNAPLAPGGLRPSSSEGNVVQIESSGRSETTEFRTQVSRMPQAGLHWMLNYGWVFSRNTADGPFALPADNRNLDAEWGPSLQDIRHRIFGMWSWQLPRGLTLGNTFRANAGPRYNITTGLDDNGDSTSNDRPAGVGRNSARGDWQWDYSSRLSWDFGFGGASSTSASGPQVRILRSGDSDILGSLRTQDVQRRFKAQIYVQATNLFNHVNRTTYSGVQTSPFFRTATASQPQRRVEAGIRLSF